MLKDIKYTKETATIKLHNYTHKIHQKTQMKGKNITKSYVRGRKNAESIRAQIRIEKFLTIGIKNDNCQTHMQKGRWAMDEKDKRLGNSGYKEIKRKTKY